MEWSVQQDPALARAQADLSRWWQLFGDPLLDSIVSRAHASNPGLEIAALRVLEARAQLAIADSLKYPQSQVLSGDASYVNPPRSDLLELLDVDDFWQFSFGGSVVWELDFWGRYRRAAEAAQAAWLASEEAYNQSLALLTAQVVTAYVVVRELQEQLRISRDNVVLQQRSFDIASVLYRHGQDSELDMRQAQTLLLSTQATIPALEGSLAQARNALSLLLGEWPGALQDRLAEPATLPGLPDSVAIGFPADLLRRRPDVRQAEWLAMAQNARLGLAAADRYPRFALFGSIGLSAGGPGDSDFGDLFNRDAISIAAGASFSWPFLDYGRVSNSIRVEDARLQQALLAYHSTVLNAAREAESAMAAYLGAREQAAILQQTVTAAQRSSDLSMLRYREGFSDYQRVLDSQARLFNQQQRWVGTRAQAVRDLVTLFQALGGGWEHRTGSPGLPQETVDTMRSRSDWGELLEAAEAQQP